MATVENLSQSPIVLRVDGAFVRIEAGAKHVVNDVKAFAKAVRFYAEAGELALEGFGKSAPKPVVPVEPEPEKTPAKPETTPADAETQEPEEEVKE